MMEQIISTDFANAIYDLSREVTHTIDGEVLAEIRRSSDLTLPRRWNEQLNRAEPDRLQEGNIFLAVHPESPTLMATQDKKRISFSYHIDYLPDNIVWAGQSTRIRSMLADLTLAKIVTSVENKLVTTDHLKPPDYIYAEQLQPSKQAKLLYKTTREIILELDEQFILVDFRERAGLKPGENLKNKHYQIITAEEIIERAERNGWGIGQRNGFPYVYDGGHWKLLEEGELRVFLRQVAQKIGVNKFDAQYHLFVDQLYKQFMELSRIPIRERDPGVVLINLSNGTFEISPRGRLIRPPDRNDFITYRLPFAYDPTAKSPIFDQYLSTVQPDEECRQLLAEFIGYLFVNSDWLKLEKALILHGSGANGKSVFFEIITALLGPQNVSSYSLSSLTDEKGYHRAKLQNVLVNYASEITDKLDANLFKQLASGEPIEARLPYGQPFILTNYAKLIFNCNELPRGAENTPAFFRRFAIVPFGVTIPDGKQDKQLAPRIIQEELSGVFNWVLGGLERLLAQRKLTNPLAVQEQVKAYQLESDSVKLFMNESGYEKSLSRYQPIKNLYTEYKNFCAEDGHRPVSKSTYTKRLRNDGFHTERKNIGWVVYLDTAKK